MFCPARSRIMWSEDRSVPQLNVFRWQPGRGWLVLSGGGSLESDDVQSVEARLLARTVSQGPVVYVWAAGDLDSADRHMDSLREMGARTGYLVDILSETDEEISARISEAGVIIVGDGPQQDALHDALSGVVLEAMHSAFSRGATIYAVGLSAEQFGAHRLGERDLAPGIHWLERAIVVSGYTPDMAEGLRQVVRQTPHSFGLGIGQGAAVALGPLGEVGVWGSAAVTVALGQDYAVE